MIGRIHIVVVNFRTPKLCIDLVESIACFRDEKTEVTVVDNDSGDDSVAILCRTLDEREWGDWVKVCQTKCNSGFSFGNNIGIQSRTADAFLLINSDTILRNSAIAILKDALEKDASIGIVGPRLEWLDAEPQESCFNNFKPSGEFFAAAATGWLERVFGYTGIAYRVSDMPRTADWISFACVLIRAEVFEKVGLLDEGYFMYFDDADFCRVSREAGYSVFYQPTAQVVHLRGGSGPVKEASLQRNRRPRYWYASRARYYAKWYGWQGLMAANVFWTVGRCVSLARELLGLKKPHVCAHEWRDIWTNFWSPINGPNR